jgi:hypothetical protein
MVLPPKKSNFEIEVEAIAVGTAAYVTRAVV